LIAVLLPGMDGSGEFFADFAAALAPEVEPVVVSYPQQDAGYEQLEAIARRALPSSPYLLVGESFSGPLALSIAASGPAGLRGVILVCSFARNPSRWPRFLLPLVTRIPLQLLPLHLAAGALLGRFASPERNRLLASSISRMPASVWRSRLRAIASVDVTSRLDAITVPVLYFRASHDAVVRRAASEHLAGACRNLRIVDFDGPHFLLQAQPEETAACVKAFAREVGG
jgi:pimeloyl-ACP methyl ester carboxylesterase